MIASEGGSDQSPAAPSRTTDPRGGRVSIPRFRPHEGLALFSQGFRPFFLLGAAWAVVAIGAFLAMLTGRLDPPAALDAATWHAHEMIFGFAGAALAGFLLTAIPNWTGRLPLQGTPLMVLVGLWVLARAAVLFGSENAPFITFLALAYPGALLAVAAREIVVGRSWRNLPLIAGLAAFLIADTLFILGATGVVQLDSLPKRFGIAVFASLITLIGGRIVPSFTHTWLKARGATVLPPGNRPIRPSSLLLTVAALITWTVAPVGTVTGALCGLAAIANLLRLTRWQGHQTITEPLLWVLHLGYGWIPVGLALIATTALSSEVTATAAMHALTAGAMGTMILAVMSRATLGHTSRALRAGPGLTAAYVLVTAGAVMRIVSAMTGDPYVTLLLVAAIAWAGAYVVFLWICGPMLLAPRPRKEGSAGPSHAG